jgi:hypothetical protein
MREIWLRPNVRAVLFACVPPAVCAAVGAWLAISATSGNQKHLSYIGTSVFVAGLATIAFLLWQLRRPRVAYTGGHVLFYLRAGRPIAVPVAHVEAFFLGQGPTRFPGNLGKQEAVNLVARLARRASEWTHQEVKPSLGSWCDGYVTIRGTWCEPLGTDVVRRLNRRLKEVQTESDGSI